MRDSRPQAIALACVRIFAATVLVLVFAAPAAAGPFENAIAAHNKGDYAMALRLFRSLADRGDAQAQIKLGFMYQGGRGVEVDNRKALFWYQAASDQGDVEALFHLGTVYRYGIQANQNVQDNVRAYTFFSLAANLGHQGAAESRDEVANILTAAQIAKAKELARDWKPKR